ncbi:flagellar biosynthesis protein FlhG [Evansella vedderi]|uniref:Flagellar biosynthesis protein FlhG n=1 Tax=Evansella vedderi TaxID=38282 RepID=A0ABT9ZR29_9BACI|nr:MinD/ParA family protein [Evansella vedderi]MDQ0253694.1 flagellar biosynthesis protein FlhG [Evansella vedderi]
MKDQADVLRERMAYVRQGAIKNTKVIAVVSGKGGVGKSNFVVNFAIALQQLNKKVLVFDLDIGMANVDILLGRTSFQSIVDMLEKDLNIREIIEDGPEGLTFVSGGSGLTELFEMNQQKIDIFIKQLFLLQQDYDYIIFDMAAGVSNDSLQFLLSAHEVILVTTPEPTSITDAYATIKYIHSQDKKLPISLVVNRIHDRREGPLTAENMAAVCSKFLGKEITHLSTIPDDEAVSKAVRSQTPFILKSPRAESSKAIKETAKSYIGTTEIQSDKGGNSLHSFVDRFTSFFRKQGI